MTFDEWQRQFCNEHACITYLVKRRWPEGFSCPRCGHCRSYLLQARRLRECKKCHHQTSVTAGTLFHGSKVPLRKWFWGIYWVSIKDNRVSALRLSQLIGVSCHTALIMIRKLRTVMTGETDLYWVTVTVELNEALTEFRENLSRNKASAEVQSSRGISADTYIDADTRGRQGPTDKVELEVRSYQSTSGKTK